MQTSIGHPSVDGAPADAAKQTFIGAIFDACADANLATDTSGYGEGGGHDGSASFDHSDAIELALDAWYRHLDVPAPTGTAARAEYEWWNEHLAGGTSTLRDAIETLRHDMADAGFDPEGYVRRGRLAGASLTEVSAVSALAVHDRIGGHIHMRCGHYFNVAGNKVVDLNGTATATGGPSTEVCPEAILADERIAGLWRRLRTGLGINEPAEMEPEPVTRLIPGNR